MKKCGEYTKVLERTLKSIQWLMKVFKFGYGIISIILKWSKLLCKTYLTKCVAQRFASIFPFPISVKG